MIGQTLGHYRITAKLGQGGMGDVYRARDLRLGRLVALKLPKEGDGSGRNLDRLLQEARTAASLNHPNICTIYDVCTDATRPFIAMEYLHGRTLDQVIPKDGLPIESALRYVQRIAAALSHAHEKGFLHRDLKPANVMITEDEAVKVLDFGLAQALPNKALEEFAASASTLIEPTALCGTLPYMAPELLQGRPADTRSDIYALGVILYEAIAGFRPFAAKTAPDLSSCILRDRPRPLARNVPPPLHALIYRCLEKGPERRYAQARQVELRLEAFRTTAAKASRLALVDRAVQGCQHSIAVLPLINLSGDPSEEFFADGMTDALITELAKAGGLRVISRTSSMHYKRTDKQLGRIAEELQVDTLLEGSFLRAEGRVRITAQLVEGSTDTHLWAGDFERDLQDILSLQAEVARAVSERVLATLAPSQKPPNETVRPVNLKAHEAYLRGRHFLHKVAEAPAYESLRLFQQAIDFDPAYAPAYAGLADAYVQLGSWLKALPVDTAMPRAKAAAKKALTLDRSLAEAHSLLAYVSMFYDWDWAAVVRECQRAIELNPSYPVAHLYFSWYLDSQNRLEEALAELEIAKQLDPLSPWIEANAAFCPCWAGRCQEAIDGLKPIVRANPEFALAHWMLGAAYAAKGLYFQAVEEFRETLAQGNQYLGWLGYALALSGQIEDAQRILERMQGLFKNKSVSADDIARVHIGLGDIDQAFRWLNRALDERAVFVVYLKVDQGYEPLRSDPRYRSLLDRMGLNG